MRSSNLLPICGLVVTGLLLVAGNLWFTAARSTIPLELHGMIFDREIRNEKHPGFDDVFFIIMDDGRRLHVDQSVFQNVEIGDLVEKRRFEHALIVSHKAGEVKKIDLVPSEDHRGMHTVMPIALGTALALAGIAWWTRTDQPLRHKGTKEETDASTANNDRHSNS